METQRVISGKRCCYFTVLWLCCVSLFLCFFLVCFIILLCCRLVVCDVFSFLLRHTSGRSFRFQFLCGVFSDLHFGQCVLCFLCDCVYVLVLPCVKASDVGECCNTIRMTSWADLLLRRFALCTIQFFGNLCPRRRCFARGVWGRISRFFCRHLPCCFFDSIVGPSSWRL